MSRFHGNDWECPGCGLKYKDLRTGFTYNSVHKLLWDNSDDSSRWKYKRPGTVLGLWHQMKKELWESHIDGCFDSETGEIPF